VSCRELAAATTGIPLPKLAYPGMAIDIDVFASKLDVDKAFMDEYTSQTAPLWRLNQS